jgi:hypothetical protein
MAKLEKFGYFKELIPKSRSYKLTINSRHKNLRIIISLKQIYKCIGIWYTTSASACLAQVMVSFQ